MEDPMEDPNTPKPGEGGDDTGGARTPPPSIPDEGSDQGEGSDQWSPKPPAGGDEPTQ
jgi:hypothetical protein